MFAFMGNNQPNPDAFDFAKRLNEALDAVEDAPRLKDGRAPWLAKKIGVSQPSAHSWLVGEYLPKPLRAEKIAAMAGVNYEWLYFGKGPKEAGKRLRDAAAPYSASPSHSMSEDHFKLALRLTAEAIGRDLYVTPEEQTAVGLSILDMLANGLPEAQVLPIARRMAAAFSQGRQKDDATRQHGRRGH